MRTRSSVLFARRLLSCAAGAAPVLLLLLPLLLLPQLATRAHAQQAPTSAATGDSGAAHHGPAPSPYPVAPSAVIDTRRLAPAPAWSGYVAARQTRRNDSTQFAVNRARLTVVAAPRPYLALRIQGDLSNVGRVARDSSVAASLLTDAFVQLAPPRAAGAGGATAWYARVDPALLVGQFKAPFSLEYLTSFALLKTADRSQAVDRLAVKRDVGVMAQLHATPLVTLAGALLNGEGANATHNPDDRELALGRVTLRPVASLALAGKWAGQGPDHLWGYDARWLWRGATLEGEAVHRQGRAPGAPASAAPLAAPYAAGGGYALAAYRVLPWLEPVAKWERFREERSAIAGGVAASEVWLTTGATLGTPDERLRFQANWVRKRTHPVDRHENELLAQLVAVF